MNLNLKKLAFSLLVAGCSVTIASAQNYKKGDNLLNIGAGFGGGFGTPIGLSFEHGFSDKISGGVYVAYASKTEALPYVGDYKWTYILTAARASYHFSFGGEKLDPYLGAMLGYNIASGKWASSSSIPYSGASAGGFIWGGHAGARYLFSEKIGVFAEVGYGVGNLNAGVTFKF